VSGGYFDYKQFACDDIVENLEILALITKYHIAEAYPPRDRRMPSRGEIKEVLAFSEELFEEVCEILEISSKEVKVWKS